MRWKCQQLRTTGCCGPVAESRKPAALFIDGGHLEAAFRKYGRPDRPLPALLEELERVFNVIIVRKELHQVRVMLRSIWHMFG